MMGEQQFSNDLEALDAFIESHSIINWDEFYDACEFAKTDGDLQFMGYDMDYIGRTNPERAELDMSIIAMRDGNDFWL